MRILMLEDDATIAQGLEYSLENEGYEVVHASGVKEAIKMIDENEFSLCLLDLTLEDGSGYDVCKYVKKKGDTPVVFLTAYDDEVNVVMGLDLGADDYISKPFRVRELLARIKTVLRRSQGNVSDTISIGDITIKLSEMRVLKSGQDVNLTALEYRLFLVLVQNKNVVLSRNKFLEGIWDVAGDFVSDNTLTVYIKRLREKIEDDVNDPQIIKTIRGLGYKVEQ